MSNAARQTAAGPTSLRTLGIDIGGTGIKASVLDAEGRMLAERVRVETPHPCGPESLLRALATLAALLPRFDRISIGFPGVIRDGRVITAPHFEREYWSGYPLADAVAAQFGKPARVLNDAEIQGMGTIAGTGLEVVLTLGTGVGSAIFRNGQRAPHIELAHHPIHGKLTYNDYVGDAALREVGAKKWNRRVARVITIVESLIHYDILYLGGGNAPKFTASRPQNVRITANDTGITGGIHLWDLDCQARRERTTRTSDEIETLWQG